MEKLDKNVVAVGRYNKIRAYCAGSKNLKPVPLTWFGQTGVYNSDLFSKKYPGVKVLNYAGRTGGHRIWFKGWCAVELNQ